MMRTVAVVLFAVVLATVLTTAQTGQDLYQQGLGKAQLGDYEGAIRIFDRIVRESPGNRPLVARAKLQMADCWLKLGDAKARDLLNDVIRNYKDQPDVIAQARRLAERTGRLSRLTDKDVLVLADFRNTTDDPVFDLALQQALVFQIEQSPLLKIMDAEQVQQALQFLRRSPDAPLTSAVAHDVCVREQEKATLQGSIAKIGETYLITLEATNCQTGTTLAREQVRPRDKNGVLQALADAATGMRIKLGESLSSIESLRRSYSEGLKVTTASLEALREFALAEREFDKGSQAAVPHYRRATELDPDFAMGFAVGSRMYRNVGQVSQSNEFADKAYALVDRVSSERERLFITAVHYGRTGELNKQVETYELLTRLYPRDTMFHNNLANGYNAIGETDKAIAEYQAAIGESPRNWLPSTNLANIHLQLERIEDAKAVLDDAIARGLEAPELHLRLLLIANLENDAAAADKQRRWFAGKPEEYNALILQAILVLLRGQPGKAHECLARARVLMERANLNERVQRNASIEKQIDGYLASGPSPFVLNAPGLPVSPTTAMAFFNAQKLLAAGATQAAADEFQKVIDRPYGGIWFRPFAYVGSARSAALAGDTARARKAYEEFFEFWKDAEPDVALLVDAQKEYAALK